MDFDTDCDKDILNIRTSINELSCYTSELDRDNNNNSKIKSKYMCLINEYTALLFRYLHREYNSKTQTLKMNFGNLESEFDALDKQRLHVKNLISKNENQTLVNIQKEVYMKLRSTVLNHIDALFKSHDNIDDLTILNFNSYLFEKFKFGVLPKHGHWNIRINFNLSIEIYHDTLGTTLTNKNNLYTFIRLNQDNTIDTFKNQDFKTILFGLKIRLDTTPPERQVIESINTLCLDCGDGLSKEEEIKRSFHERIGMWDISKDKDHLTISASAEQCLVLTSNEVKFLFVLGV